MQTIGTRGIGRWVTIHTDDTDVIVTAYEGWGITDEVRLSGRAAVALAQSIAADLFA